MTTSSVGPETRSRFHSVYQLIHFLQNESWSSWLWPSWRQEVCSLSLRPTYTRQHCCLQLLPATCYWQHTTWQNHYHTWSNIAATNWQHCCWQRCQQKCCLVYVGLKTHFDNVAWDRPHDGYGWGYVLELPFWYLYQHIYFLHVDSRQEGC